MGDVVGKISIISLTGAFVMYIVFHVIIGILQKNFQAALEKKPGDAELTKNLKIATFLFKWFPAIYVLLALMIFFFG